MGKRDQQTFDLTPEDNRRLAELCGQFNQHIKQVEQELDVEVFNRGHHFQVTGNSTSVKKASHLIQNLYEQTQKKDAITPAAIHLMLRHANNFNLSEKSNMNNDELSLPARRGAIKPQGENQQQYLTNILSHDINFGIGPAGTGKTYLAVGCAVAALEKGEKTRILLVRPAVEAGEKLGFLPGDFNQKLDPYFRPLYDALYEMIGFEEVIKLVENHTVEVVPLAYMRGRTLNDAFIILDEAQNTTKEQMKMFLTRIGFNSKVVVTGDLTQTDLPKGSVSGLNHTLSVLQGVKGISMTYFQPSDVVRHPLVQSILEAYERYEEDKAK